MSDLDNEMNGMNENEMGEEEDIIVFESEDGEEVSFSVMDYFFYNGDEYAVLQEYEPENEDEIGCVICRITTETDENGEEVENFELVEDEELGQKLFDIAMTRLDEDAEE